MAGVHMCPLYAIVAQCIYLLAAVNSAIFSASCISTLVVTRDACVWFSGSEANPLSTLELKPTEYAPC